MSYCNLNYHRSYVSGWPEHWTNGGTGVTKTSDPKIIESVKLFNDPTIIMKGDELHQTGSKTDMSEFWKFHRNRIGEKL